MPGAAQTGISASRISSEIGKKKAVWIGLGIAVLAVLLYFPVRQHAFLRYDDYQYVTHNDRVLHGLSSDSLKWAFTTYYEANWHPLTWLSHMLDCQVFGLSAKAHHFVNAGLHAANVFLLFLLLFAATGAVWRSAFVAALFAVHPLNVETVAWVAERKSLLSMFFSLVTVLAYGYYARHPDWKKYLLVVIGFALALMSKPMAVTLPFVLLLLDYWPLCRYEDLPVQDKWWRLAAEKLPLLLMTAGSCAVTVVAQRSGGAIEALPILIRIENALTSYVAYIGKTLWPINLAIFYPHPERALPMADVIAAAFILVVITAAVLYARRARYLLVGWFIFLGTLVPVIGIVQAGHQGMSDRYAYIPCIGLFLMLAWGLHEIAPTKAAAAAVFCLAIVALSVDTHRYLQYWTNGTKLFTRAREIAGSPDWMIEEALADSLFDEGHLREAFTHYREACIQRPWFAYCHYNMATLLLANNQAESALQECRVARRLAPPDDGTLLFALAVRTGQVLLAMGDINGADMEASTALRMNPNDAEAQSLRQQIAQKRK